MRVRRYQVFQVYQIIFVRQQLINSKRLPINNYTNFGDIESELFEIYIKDFVRS